MHAPLHSVSFQIQSHWPGLNQVSLDFAFRIDLIVSFFLFGTCIGSAEEVEPVEVGPVTVQGTCAEFASEIIKGLRPINGKCGTGKPVRGRCPGEAGQTTFTPGKLQKLPYKVVTNGYYCSCNGKFSMSADGCAATCSGGPKCSAQQ